MLVSTTHLLQQAQRGGYAVGAFNVNTELREAGLRATETHMKASGKKELVDLMEAVIEAMQKPVITKLKLFGSAGRAV